MVDTEWKVSDLSLMDKVMSSVGFNSEQLELLVDGVGKSEKVLDLCLGFGNLASLLIKKGKVVYGLDKNPNSFDYVAQKLGGNDKNFYPVVGDVYNINFEGEFDVVTCASSIGSMDELDLITKEIYNSLIPKGKVVLTGMEKSKYEIFQQNFIKKLSENISSGKLKLSEEEAKRIAELQEPTKRLDSQGRMLDSLINNGFMILDARSFYSDSGYFLKAEKV